MAFHHILVTNIQCQYTRCNSILGDMIIETDMNLHCDFEIDFDIEGQGHISSQLIFWVHMLNQQKHVAK